MVEGTLQFDKFQEHANKQSKRDKFINNLNDDQPIFMSNKEFIKSRINDKASSGIKIRKIVNSFLENLFCHESRNETEFMSLLSVLLIWRTRNFESFNNIINNLDPEMKKILGDIKKMFCYFNYTQKKLKMRKYVQLKPCLLYTSPSPRDLSTSRMPSSA